MPDADIPPIVLTDEEIAEIQSAVPLLPSYYRDSWKIMDIDQTVENALLVSRQQAELIERILQQAGPSAARRVAFWFLIAITDELDESGDVMTNSTPISDDYFIELAAMVDKNELSSTAAKEVFFTMLKTSESPRKIAESKNLIQVSDEGAIAAIVDEVLADPSSAQAVKDLKEGNHKVIGFLVGQVMKKSQGKANPELAQKLIRERVE
jgi:aspartyl-tRNA(Asn)/glutamyl-tRNA(Gln) amidotransferase subunit B